MNPNSYLELLASRGVVRELEKVNINRSLSLLQKRLDEYFSQAASNASGLKNHFAFGSYTRGTMLPRSMDPHSDVDYLVIFNESSLLPTSCLERLKRFVSRYYKNSEVYQSHPTIILSLNHIKFELVPAIETGFSGIQIATKESFFSHWAATSPNEFNKALTEKNKDNDNLIKPLVRIIKYWNSRNDYPFESYFLENCVVEHWTIRTVFCHPSLWERFSVFIQRLNGNSVRQSKAIDRAIKIISEVRALESQGQADMAGKKLEKLLPYIS